MPFCPVPHASRDQIWMSVGLSVGIAIGVAVAKRLMRTSTLVQVTVPKRVFKLAVASEVAAFKKAGWCITAVPCLTLLSSDLNVARAQH